MNTDSTEGALAWHSPRTGSRRRRMSRYRRATDVAPGLVASTLMVLVVAPALPDWAGLILFFAGLSVAMLLMFGVGESLAIRLLFHARELTQSEWTGLRGVVAKLCGLELGPPIVDFYVARRRGAPVAIAHGRRSVVVAPELLGGIMTGQLQDREATAVLAHACSVVRSGLVRQDPAIVFWSTPWRMLSVIGRPARGLLGFAWRVRIVVFGVAIWQSAADSPSTSSGPLSGLAIAAALIVILALTYLLPQCAEGWEDQVSRAGDHYLVALGLGPAMASFLRRYPQRGILPERIQALELLVREE